MKIEKIITETQEVEISERELLEIIKKYMIEHESPRWANARFIISNQSVAPYMGQLDDEYETVVIGKLIKETKE